MYGGMSVIFCLELLILKDILILKSGVKIAIKIKRFKQKMTLIPINRKGPILWRNERYLLLIIIDDERYLNPEIGI